MRDQTKVSPSRAAFAKRVEMLIKMIGSGSALANIAGVSEGVIRKWKSGESDPSRENLISLAKASGVCLEWLATGEGPKTATPQTLAAIPSSALARLVSSDYAFIPLYDVRAAAGPGAFVESEEIDDLLVINRLWIREYIGVDPAGLSFLYIEGDSMEPLLRPGEMILMHRCAAHVPVDGIYVIRVDGHLMVKRIQRELGNILTLSSANPAYKPITVRPGDGRDLVVIGRVVWHGRNL